MSAENSGLHALAELRALEADRIARDRERITRAAQEALVAREQAARVAAEAEQRAQWERQQAWQRAAELQHAAELAERQRLAVVAEQARVEQQHRLLLEQQRLDERMRAAERASRPRWPYAVVPALVAAIGLSAAIAWHTGGEADRIAAADDAQRTAYEQQMAQVQEKLDALAAKQRELEAERDTLASRLLEATTAAERSEIEAQIAAVDRELAAADTTTATSSTTKPSKPASQPGSKPRPATKPTAKPEVDEDQSKPGGRKPIVVGEGTDPLEGLD